MPQTAIGLDVLQSLNILPNFAIEWTFHEVITVQKFGDTAQFAFADIASPALRIG